MMLLDFTYVRIRLVELGASEEVKKMKVKERNKGSSERRSRGVITFELFNEVFYLIS